MAVSPSTTEDIRLEQREHVLIITLNRPDRLNAISGPMLNALADRPLAPAQQVEDADARRVGEGSKDGHAPSLCGSANISQ